MPPRSGILPRSGGLPPCHGSRTSEKTNSPLLEPTVNKCGRHGWHVVDHAYRGDRIHHGMSAMSLRHVRSICVMLATTSTNTTLTTCWLTLSAFGFAKLARLMLFIVQTHKQVNRAMSKGKTVFTERPTAMSSFARRHRMPLQIKLNYLSEPL